MAKRERRIVNRFRELKALKERQTGRNISQREIARQTGLSKTTVDRYARNDVERYDEPVLLRLCDYFGCDVGEFLLIEEVESPETENQLTTAA